MYRIGVIGCGVIWNKKHAPALEGELADRAQVVSVFDVEDSAAKDAAARFSGARAAKDWREIVDDPEIDVVLSCSPPFVRAEHAVAAAKNGKHLLLEKPMARTLEDARAIESAVLENGVRCEVCFMRSMNVAV